MGDFFPLCCVCERIVVSPLKVQLLLVYSPVYSSLCQLVILSDNHRLSCVTHGADF